MKKNRGRPALKKKKQPKKSILQFRSSWLIFVVMGVVLAVVAFWGAHSQTKKNSEKPAKAQIIITAGGFNPQNLNAKVGTQITWVNNDTRAHQVIADSTDGNPVLGFDNNLVLRAGDSYSFTFIHPGTYSYHDQLNPDLVPGLVTVQ